MGRSIKEQLRQEEFSDDIQGHGLMDSARFREDTKHMIVFDVLLDECPVGFAGERIRIFLSEDGYETAVESEKRGEMVIKKHYKVYKGNLKHIKLESKEVLQ